MSVAARLAIQFLCLALAHHVLADDVEWRGAPLHEYVASFARQDLTIIFSSNVLKDEFLVLQEPVADEPLQALREALAPYGLKLTEGPGDSYLVVKDPDRSGSIAIAVTESGNDLPVERARILIDGNLAGHTDAAGKALIEALSPGTHELSITAPGYTSSGKRREFVLAEQITRFAISIAPLATPLPEIVVTSSSYNLQYADPATHTFLDRELTTKLPDVGDEAVRAIDRLPGTANGGVSSKTHVRGGVENEELLLFDGLRLYEPYHLKDFYSLSTIIDQNAISGIDFYSAGYQARYGDRMSGVIDISLREPPIDTVTELSLSFFNASLLSIGTFGGEERGDWLVSARRGNLDLIADVIEHDYGAPRYQNLLMHVGWRWNDRSYLSANSLLSYDKISIAEPDKTEQANARYRNHNIWLKLVTQWNADLASTTILSAARIDDARLGWTDRPGVVAGTMDDDRSFRTAGLKQTMAYEFSDDWIVNAGFELHRHEARYAHHSELAIESPFDQIFDNQPLRNRDIEIAPEGAQYAVFLESRWRLSDALILDAGLRWDQQTYTIANNDDQTSPRLNLLYQIGDRTELRFGFGQFYQAQEINELQVSDGVSEFFPAQRARHTVASLSHQFASDMELRIEWYEKEYRLLMPRFENVFDPLALIPELQIDRVRIAASGAVSRGAEIMLSRESRQNNIFWWASYAWSEIFDETSLGDVARSWDQTHTLKAGINWDWRKWSFSMAGQLHSGWPNTALTVDTVTNVDGSTTLVASTSPRNSLRHRVFHTVDARISRQFDVKRGSLTTFMELTNIYNRENPCCTEYSIATGPDGNQIVVGNEGTWLPLLPSLGIIWRF